MSPLELTSAILLWLGFFTLLGVNLILIRQIGILYERVAPAGALSTASRLHVGNSPPVVGLISLSGRELEIPNKRLAHSMSGTFILFSSPDCPLCKKITPIVLSVLRDHADIELLVASAGANIQKHEKYLKTNNLNRDDYIVSDDLPISWGISKLPYGVLLNKQGAVAAFGLINTREHVESLFEAFRLDVPDLQTFLTEPIVATSDSQNKNNGAVHG